MKKNPSSIFRVQKKVGFLGAAIGFVVVITNIVRYSDSLGFQEAIKKECIYILAPITLISLISAFVDRGIIRVMQFFGLYVTALISILDDYKTREGIGLLALAILLGFKYKFFETRAILKFILIVLSIFATIQISLIQNSVGTTFVFSIYAIAYLALMVLFIYILYMEEIHDYLHKQKQFSSDISRLRMERERLEKKIREEGEKLVSLNKRIILLEEGRKPLNLDEYRITPAEKKIMRILCLYRCENREIAQRLHISVPTVKTHLSHIMDKLGVDDRFAVIDMCRNNFRESDL